MKKYIIAVMLSCAPLSYGSGFYLFHWGYYENTAKVKAATIALKNCAKEHSTSVVSGRKIELYTTLGLLTVGTINIALAAYYFLKK